MAVGTGVLGGTVGFVVGPGVIVGAWV